MKQFPVPGNLPVLFDYFAEFISVSSDMTLDSLLNGLVKCSDSRVLVGMYSVHCTTYTLYTVYIVHCMYKL